MESALKDRFDKGTFVEITGPDSRGGTDLVGAFGQVVQTVQLGGLPTHELRTTYDPGKPGYQVDTGDTIANFPDSSVKLHVYRGRGTPEMNLPS